MLVIAGPALAQKSEEFVALHQQDLRLARIADRMLIANHALCREVMPVSGLVIHSQDQYGPEAAGTFADGAVKVAAVVSDSPADAAGLMPGDALLAIDGTALAELPATAGAPLRDSVFELLAARPAAGEITLLARRGGREWIAALRPQPGCRALVEVLSDSKRIARSDGRVIQLSYGLASEMSDDALAVTFAHELAHVVLEHRRRLSEAGVRKGLLGEFGGNRRRNRQVEVEADRLSVHLLANAGFDPAIAPRFWRSREGRRVDAGIFRSSIYPSPSERAEIMQREIEEFLQPAQVSSWPGHLLAARDEPF